MGTFPAMAESPKERALAKKEQHKKPEAVERTVRHIRRAPCQQYTAKERKKLLRADLSFGIFLFPIVINGFRQQKIKQNVTIAVQVPLRRRSASRLNENEPLPRIILQLIYIILTYLRLIYYCFNPCPLLVPSGYRPVDMAPGALIKNNLCHYVISFISNALIGCDRPDQYRLFYSLFQWSDLETIRISIWTL